MNEGPDENKSNDIERLNDIPGRFQSYLRNIIKVRSVYEEEDDGFIIRRYVYGSFEHNGELLPTQITFETTEVTDGLKEGLEVIVGEGDDYVVLNADIFPGSKVGHAESRIMRSHGEYTKPPAGLGIHLYETIFSYFDGIAAHSPCPFINRVIKSKYGYKSMTPERWRERFHLLLIRQEYTQVDEDGLVWEKVYGSETTTT